MKKLIYTIILVFAVFYTYGQVETSIDSGIVVGSFDLGSKEVTIIINKTKGCVVKSNPHSKNILQPNEQVQLVLKKNKHLLKIVKPNLVENVFAKRCADSSMGKNIFALMSGEGGGTVSVSCNGSCDCSLMGQLSESGSYVSCSCNECTMQIRVSKFKKSGDKIFDRNLFLKKSKIEVPFLKKYLKFSNNSPISEIYFHRKGKAYVVTYNFIDSKGNSESITYVNAIGKVYEIQCNGSCGCKETYSLETNTASCSCNECTLQIKEITM